MGKLGTRRRFKVLGPLEVDVMLYIWSHGQSTGRDVHRHLGPRHDIAYTTVATTLERLVTKGLLTHEVVSRKGEYRYAQARSKHSFVAQVARDLLSELHASDDDHQRMIEELVWPLRPVASS